MVMAILATTAISCTFMSSPHDSYFGLPYGQRNLGKAVDPSWHQEGQNAYPGFLAYEQINKAGQLYASGKTEAAEFVGNKVVEVEGLRSRTAESGGYGYGRRGYGNNYQSTYNSPRIGILLNRADYTYWVSIDGGNQNIEVPCQGFKFVTLSPGRHTLEIKNSQGTSTTAFHDINERRNNCESFLPGNDQKITTDWSFTIR